MTDQYVQVQADSTGKKIDTSEVVVGANTVERQRIVLADPTAPANFVTVSSDGSLRVQPQARVMGNFVPAPGYSTEESISAIQLDSSNQVMARSSVFTDEGSLREDYLDSVMFATLTGTATFVNGSTSVVGIGTLFTTEMDQFDYVRLASQGESAWTRVSSIDDDTHMTLASGYSGASGTGSTVFTDWPTTTIGTGATATQGNSLLNISTGTTSGAGVYVWRIADFPPFSFVVRCELSQMIANQEFGFGLADNPVNPGMQARVSFSGTDPSKVTFTVGTSTASGNQQSTVVTIPNGLLTQYNTFQIDVQTQYCVLTINQVLITTFNFHVPYPYDTLAMYMYGKNTGTVASSTTFSIDWIDFSNYDQLQVTSRVPLNTNTTLTSPQGAGIPPWYATITPNSRLRVSGELYSVFSDTFDGPSVDQAARWVVTVNGAGTATQSSGNLVLTTGTTAGNGAAVSSQPSYAPAAVNFGVLTVSAKFESTPFQTNAHRFWGVGLPNTSFSATTPLSDAIGYEIDVTGTLSAVVYASNVRIFSQALFLATDGSYHRFRIVFRPDQAHFYVDSWDVPYARASFLSPSVQTLPVRVHMINNTTAPTAAPTLALMNIGLGDSGPNTTSISDGTYPWREITVGPKGTQGSYGLMTQDMKDTGRTMVTLMVDATGGVISESLAAVTLYRNGASNSGTSFAVTTGKTFRISAMSISVSNTLGILATTRVRLRSSFSASATTTSSAIVAALQAAAPVATTGAAGVAFVSFSDGIELASGTTFAISHIENTGSSNVTISVTGFEY